MTQFQVVTKAGTEEWAGMAITASARRPSVDAPKRPFPDSRARFDVTR
jgi:hypothetical protein